MPEVTVYQERFVIPSGAKAALSVRSAEFVGANSKPYELLVGHCAISGAISDTHLESLFNFYVGVDPEPRASASRALMLGIYQVPGFTSSRLYARAKSGLTPSLHKLTSDITGFCQGMDSSTITSDATESARQRWQTLLANDFVRGGAGNHHNLLHADNHDAVAEAVFLYAQRSKNRFSETAQHIVDLVWARTETAVV